MNIFKIQTWIIDIITSCIYSFWYEIEKLTKFIHSLKFYGWIHWFQIYFRCLFCMHKWCYCEKKVKTKKERFFLLFTCTLLSQSFSFFFFDWLKCKMWKKKQKRLSLLYHQCICIRSMFKSLVVVGRKCHLHCNAFFFLVVFSFHFHRR